MEIPRFNDITDMMEHRQELLAQIDDIENHIKQEQAEKLKAKKEAESKPQTPAANPNPQPTPEEAGKPPQNAS